MAENSRPDKLRIRATFGSEIQLPIQYRLIENVESPLHQPCTLCGEQAGYTCAACKPNFKACFRCVQQYAREAHFAHYGKGHEMGSIQNSIECYVCKKIPAERFNICNYCGLDDCFRAIMCQACFSNHTNVEKHMKGGSKRHFFQSVKAIPDALREPRPYNAYDLILGRSQHQDEAKGSRQRQRLACTIYQSRIGFEFLTCIDCVQPYNLCTRCVNEGKSAKHTGHKFDFVIPYVQASMALPPNPESEA